MLRSIERKFPSPFHLLLATLDAPNSAIRAMKPVPQRAADQGTLLLVHVIIPALLARPPWACVPEVL